MAKEIFQTLHSSRSVKIERIISKGQATKKGKWLKGKRNEWVILIQGAAKLRFLKDNRVVKMKAGSNILIPANALHRVDWTDARQRTVWLAVHFPGRQSLKKMTMVFIFLILLSVAPFAYAQPPSEIEITLQANPHLTCTKEQCRQDNPCCNLCVHEGWKVVRDGEWRTVEAVDGVLPDFGQAYSCDAAAWGKLEVTGHWRNDTFYAAKWKLIDSKELQ